MTHAELQALSDSELIEKVATKVMGAQLTLGVLVIDKGQKIDGYPVLEDYRYWNPLTDWNHTRAIEQAIIDRQDGTLLSYLSNLPGDCFDNPFRCKKSLLEANQRQRCIAALLAVG